MRTKGIMALNVVIANAAINLSHPVKFIDIDTDDQDEIFKINVRPTPIFIFGVVLVR